jgi:hypothetical protein
VRSMDRHNISVDVDIKLKTWVDVATTVLLTVIGWVFMVKTGRFDLFSAFIVLLLVVFLVGSSNLCVGLDSGEN